MSDDEDEIEADCFRQEDGRVFITSMSAEGPLTLVVDRLDRGSLLSVLMTAYRTEATDDERTDAAKTCMAHLGRAKFR